MHRPAGTALQAALTLPGCRAAFEAQVGAAQKGAAAGGGRLRQLQLLRSGCIPLPPVVKHRCRQLAGGWQAAIHREQLPTRCRSRVWPVSSIKSLQSCLYAY